MKPRVRSVFPKSVGELCVCKCFAFLSGDFQRTLLQARQVKQTNGTLLHFIRSLRIIDKVRKRPIGKLDTYLYIYTQSDLGKVYSVEGENMKKA